MWEREYFDHFVETPFVTYEFIQQIKILPDCQKFSALSIHCCCCCCLLCDLSFLKLTRRLRVKIATATRARTLTTLLGLISLATSFPFILATCVCWCGCVFVTNVWSWFCFVSWMLLYDWVFAHFRLFYCKFVVFILFIPGFSNLPLSI